MIQTQWVVECLKEQDPALSVVIEPIRTTGDALTHVPLTTIGGDGVFVQEIERALLEKRIDLAVHSLKDLPTAQTAGLHVVAVGRREDVRDVLVVNGQSDHAVGRDYSLDGTGTDLPLSWEGKTTPVRIGTCSLRRTAQIRALFPGVEILPLRGNVDTRLRKLDAGDYDGIVLAAAGLHRLGVHERLADRLRYLPIEVMMPAPGQGALAVEVRDEAEMQMLIAPLRDAATEAATSAERMFMRRLGAGCYLPVAAHGEIRGESLMLKGLVISLDGQEQVRVSRSMPWTAETDPENAGRLGVQLAEEALARGAAEIINALSVTRIQERQHA
jgi:hydroxymethylbilane synthase